MARLRNSNQVWRTDGRNCFLEVLSGSLPIDKADLHFVSYDEKLQVGQRQTASIHIYLDVFDAERLSSDILSGRICKLAENSAKEAKASGTQYPGAVFTQIGGTPAKNNPDGVTICRKFTISPGTKFPFLLEAGVYPGEETPDGLIKPAGKPTSIVRLPLTADRLKDFAHALDLLFHLWGMAKFLPVVQPVMDERRERNEAEIQGRIAAKALPKEEGGEEFPMELPF